MGMSIHEAQNAAKEWRGKLAALRAEADKVRGVMASASGGERRQARQQLEELRSQITDLTSMAAEADEKFMQQALAYEFRPAAPPPSPPSVTTSSRPTRRRGRKKSGDGSDATD